MKGNKTKVHGHCLPKCRVLVQPDLGNTDWDMRCQALGHLRKGQRKKYFPYPSDGVGLKKLGRTLEKSIYKLTIHYHFRRIAFCFRGATRDLERTKLALKGFINKSGTCHTIYFCLQALFLIFKTLLFKTLVMSTKM